MSAFDHMRVGQSGQLDLTPTGVVLMAIVEARREGEDADALLKHLASLAEAQGWAERAALFDLAASDVAVPQLDAELPVSSLARVLAQHLQAKLRLQ